MEKADILIQKKKLNIKLSMDAASKHNQIEMFNENVCTKSIEDFNFEAHKNGKMINVVVKDYQAIAQAEYKESKLRAKKLEN